MTKEGSDQHLRQLLPHLGLESLGIGGVWDYWKPVREQGLNYQKSTWTLAPAFKINISSGTSEEQRKPWIQRSTYLQMMQLLGERS